MIENTLIFYKYSFFIAYSAINSVCFIMLAVVLYKMRHGPVKIPYSRYLSNNVVFIFILNTIDILWKWIEGMPITISLDMAMLINTVYFIAMHIMYFYLFLYFYVNVNNSTFDTFKIIKMSIPVMITILLNIINMKTGLLFYVTEDMRYTRGSLYILEYVVPYSYLVMPYVKSLSIIIKTKKENLPHKQIHRDILTIPAAIAISGTIGMVYKTVPVLSIGLAMTMTFLYLDMVEDFVTIDPVSSLPNKIEFIEELQKRVAIENLKHRNNLYVIVIELLHLRSVNEKYGYNEGDSIIRRVSNILRRNTTLGDKINIFVSRYSGDKFIAVLNTDDTNDIINYFSNLQLKVNKSDAINLAQYHTEIIYGVGKYKESTKLQSVIDAAITNLNLNKIRYSELQTQK